MPHEWQLLLRLLLATGLAGALGIERELHEQPAGFRTHALVALVGLRPLRSVLRRVAASNCELQIETDDQGHLGTIRTALRAHGVVFRGVEVSNRDGGGRSYSVLAEFPRGVHPQDVVTELEREPHILHVDWSD